MDRLLSSSGESFCLFIPGFVGNITKWLEEAQRDHGEALKRAFKEYTPILIVSYGNLIPLNNKTIKKQDEKTRYKNILSYAFEKWKDETESLEGICQIMLDSGGFQIVVGRISKDEVPLLMETYYSFVKTLNETESHKLHSFFFLDVQLYNSFGVCMEREMVKFNLESVERLFSLGLNKDEDLWKKLIFIVHPTSTVKFKIWERVVDKLFEKCQTLEALPRRYAVGGIAVNPSRQKESVVLFWVYGLIYLLWSFLKRGVPLEFFSGVHFHVLGLLSLHFIVGVNMVAYYLQRKYGVVLNFSFDGTAAVSKVFRARRMGFVDPKTLCYKEISLKSKDLGNPVQVGSSLTSETYFYKIINELWESVGYVPSKEYTTVYNNKTETFHKEVIPWVFFLDPYFHQTYFKRFFDVAREVVDRYIESGNTSRIWEIVNSVCSESSLDHKKLIFRQLSTVFKIIDEVIENPKNYDFETNMLMKFYGISEAE